MRWVTVRSAGEAETGRGMFAVGMSESRLELDGEARRRPRLPREASAGRARSGIGEAERAGGKEPPGRRHATALGVGVGICLPPHLSPPACAQSVARLPAPDMGGPNGHTLHRETGTLAQADCEPSQRL